MNLTAGKSTMFDDWRALYTEVFSASEDTLW